MLSWQVGDVTITRVKELEYPIVYHDQHLLPEATPTALGDIPWLRPHFVDENGHLLFSVHALLVKTPSIRLVVDTCIGNDKPRGFVGGEALQTRFLAHLERAGCGREQVTHVICTHLHVDHVGWNTMLENDRWIPTFPNARYLLGEEEYRFWSQSEDEGQQVIMADSVQPIIDAGLVDLVAMDYRLCDEIDLVPSPGHTPGHVSIRIRSQGHQAFISGDCIHHPVQMAQPDWCVRFDEDQQTAKATRKALLNQWANKDTLVIGTHFAAPTAGYVVRDNGVPGQVDRDKQRYRFKVD